MPIWNPLGGAGVGDVVGPASSIDSELTLFSGVTGKIIKGGSGITNPVAGTLSRDSGNLTLQTTTSGDIRLFPEVNSKVDITTIAVDQANYLGSDLNLTASASVGGVYVASGYNSTATWTGATGTAGGVQGGLSTAANNSTTTIGVAQGISVAVNNLSTGTITGAVGVAISNSNSGGGTVTTMTGIKLNAPNGTTNFAFDFKGNYVSGNSVSVADDGAQFYLPLSTTNDGLTFDSSDLVLATTTSGDVQLLPLTDLVFSDGNKAGSTYTSELVLSDSSGEWDTFETNFGEVSLIAAINASVGGVESLAQTLVIGNSTGGTDIEVTSGDAINATSTQLTLQTTTSGGIDLKPAGGQVTLQNETASTYTAFNIVDDTSSGIYLGLDYNSDGSDNYTVENNNTIWAHYEPGTIGKIGFGDVTINGSSAITDAVLLIDYTGGVRNVAVDGKLEVDKTSVDFGAALNLLDGSLVINNTANDAGQYKGGAFTVNKTDNFDQTLGAFDILGINAQSTLSGTGTVAQAVASNHLITNIGGGTITEAVGGVFSVGNVAGTITNYFGIRFNDLGFSATNMYAMDFVGANFVSNSRAVSVADDGVQRYMPLSTVDTGITFDSTDLVLATTTSGDIVLSPATVTDVVDINAITDIDLSVTDAAGVAGLINAQLNVQTTVNNASQFRGHLIVSNYNSANSLTNSFALNGGFYGVSNTAGGTVAGANGMLIQVANTGAGTITKGRGISINGVATAGTMTDFVGIEFSDAGSAATNVYAMDFIGTNYVSGGTAVSVADDGVQRYLPLSEADDGITYTLNDLHLRTLTSGNLVFDSAGSSVFLPSTNITDIMSVESSGSGFLTLDVASYNPNIVINKNTAAGNLTQALQFAESDSVFFSIATDYDTDDVKNLTIVGGDAASRFVLFESDGDIAFDYAETAGVATSATMFIDQSADRIGINTIVPDVDLHVSGETKLEGGQIVKRTSVADTNYTALATDYIIGYSALTATRTVSLPAAATAGVGTVYIIKDETGNSTGATRITIDPNLAETIDGAATFSIQAAYNSVTIYTDGSNWFII